MQGMGIKSDKLYKGSVKQFAEKDCIPDNCVEKFFNLGQQIDFTDQPKPDHLLKVMLSVRKILNIQK
jgi:hypothetical protein